MIDHNKSTPFLEFNREQWSALRQAVPLKLTEQDLRPLLGFNENLSLEEVKNVYLPLTRLINYYIDSNVRKHYALNRFLGRHEKNVPYIIGIAGSVSVGKSTAARILQNLLSNWPRARKVDLITTDGFLYSLEELTKRNILDKKGFPVSYDTKKLLNFVSDIKSGKENLKVPIYSHLIYDIVPDQYEIIDNPDIIILEGLNVLQTNTDLDNNKTLFVSDFVDFSIFVGAEEELLKKWYINRFLNFRKTAFADKGSYFHSYAKLDDQEAIEQASKIWDNINGLNLRENILPTKERADLIFEKGEDHRIKKIQLRK